MSKYTNSAMAEKSQVYNNVKSPCRYFLQHKAKRSIIEITDRQRTDEETGKHLRYVREKVDFLLLDIRYRITGESKAGFKVQSPLIENLSDAVPVYTIGTEGTNSQLGDKLYSWTTDKEEIKGHGMVSKASAEIVLFGILYRINDDGSVKGDLCQFSLSGYGFGSWINDSKNVDLSERFDVNAKAKAAEIANTHPKADPGEMLAVLGLDFQELNDTTGEYFLYGAEDLRNALAEYLENRTFSEDKKMDGTADAVAAVAEQKSGINFEKRMNDAAETPVSMDGLPFDGAESDEELPNMGQ